MRSFHPAIVWGGTIVLFLCALYNPVFWLGLVLLWVVIIAKLITIGQKLKKLPEQAWRRLQSL